MRLFSPLGNNVFNFKIQCLSILRLSSGVQLLFVLNAKYF